MLIFRNEFEYIRLLIHLRYFNLKPSCAENDFIGHWISRNVNMFYIDWCFIISMHLGSLRHKVLHIRFFTVPNTDRVDKLGVKSKLEFVWFQGTKTIFIILYLYFLASQYKGRTTCVTSLAKLNYDFRDLVFYFLVYFICKYVV